MKQGQLDKLLNAIDAVTDDNSFEKLYNLFGGSNYHTEEDVTIILKQRREFLESQHEIFFERVGIPKNEIATFIFFELLLIESMVKPICKLRQVEYMNELEKSTFVASISEAVETLSYSFSQHEKQLRLNFDSNLPITVHNLIAHIDQLNEYIAKRIWYEQTPFYTIISDRLKAYRKEYSTDRLYQQLMLIKRGPHSQTENAKKYWTFAELFRDEKDWNNIMEILIKESKVESESGFWKDLGGGHKKEIICLIKNLKLKGYFRNDLEIDHEILQSVIKNSFGVRTGISFISKTKPDEIEFDWLPSGKAA